MTVVRNLSVEALGVVTAEMQEEHKYGKDITESPNGRGWKGPLWVI